MLREAAHYREQAEQFREMARDADPKTAAALLMLADDFEREALRLDPPTEPTIPITE